eukprot:15480909-Alexandrium_andersonii.AAC.1
MKCPRPMLTLPTRSGKADVGPHLNSCSHRLRIAALRPGPQLHGESRRAPDPGAKQHPSGGLSLVCWPFAPRADVFRPTSMTLPEVLNARRHRQSILRTIARRNWNAGTLAVRCLAPHQWH